MRRVALISMLTVVLCATGCSTISVNHDWDRDAPFPSYRTYNWLALPESAPQDARAARARNDLLDQRVRRAVDFQLTEKGLTRAGDTPDLYVIYHTGVEQKVNVTDWGYRYSYDYWGWGGRQIDVYQYNEGTLIIDLIDANTKELVWRGSATAVVDPGDSSEKRESLINNAVAKVFQKYPPKN